MGRGRVFGSAVDPCQLKRSPLGRQALRLADDLSTANLAEQLASIGLADAEAHEASVLEHELSSSFAAVRSRSSSAALA